MRLMRRIALSQLNTMLCELGSSHIATSLGLRCRIVTSFGGTWAFRDCGDSHCQFVFGLGFKFAKVSDQGSVLVRLVHEGFQVDEATIVGVKHPRQAL